MNVAKGRQRHAASAAVRNRLRFWRSEFDSVYSALQGRAQGTPLLLEGELAGTLRSQVIAAPEVRYRAGICNAGLLKVSGGYLAIVKNNTYCFCHECGVESDFGPNDKPPRARLLLVELDEAFRVTRIARLVIEWDGRQYDDETDLHEDARLTSFGGEIWCSFNLVPRGNQWEAVPIVGRLDRENARLMGRSVRGPSLRSPQKNWLPFASEGGLYLEHSINPHVVWRLDPDASAVREQYRTAFLSAFWGPRGPFYRGSAPLMAFEDGLLGAAHSMVKIDGKRDYRTHFFLADPTPPFKLRWFGRPLKLLQPARIQYVAGMACDDQGSVVVSYGIDDCDNVFARFSASGVRATLKRW